LWKNSRQLAPQQQRPSNRVMAQIPGATAKKQTLSIR